MNFAKSIENIGLHANLFKVKPHNNVTKSDSYRVICYSKVFYQWYRNMEPEDILDVLDTRGKMVKFLKGFYEAEGYAHFSKSGQYTVAFTNTDIRLLKVSKEILLKLGFYFNLNGPYSTGRPNEKPYYNLKTSRKAQTLKFLKTIKPDITKGNLDV